MRLRLRRFTPRLATKSDRRSGIFNGQAGGCGYDPYTGNATRSITDITVAGAVGEYPLALVRTANSRTPSTTEVFGGPVVGTTITIGSWKTRQHRHAEFCPVKYTVNFPDGRVETFRAVTWDTVYRVRAGADTPALTCHRQECVSGFCSEPEQYVRVSAPARWGRSRISSRAKPSVHHRYWYTYHVTGIYDPHGLKTTIDSEVVGQARLRRITKVTEPAGRYLQFSYAPNRRISQVTEYIAGVPRRSVRYNYIYDGWLDNVVYYGHNGWIARYQYTVANISGDLPLLLRTCDDPMYPGPMKRIAYTYKPGDQLNDDGTTPVYGQILNEWGMGWHCGTCSR